MTDQPPIRPFCGCPPPVHRPGQCPTSAFDLTGTDDIAMPYQEDVDALRDLLDLLENFSSNDQRARYLLSCNWMRDRGAAAAERIRLAASDMTTNQPYTPNI